MSRKYTQKQNNFLKVAPNGLIFCLEISSSKRYFTIFFIGACNKNIRDTFCKFISVIYLQAENFIKMG